MRYKALIEFEIEYNSDTMEDANQNLKDYVKRMGQGEMEIPSGSKVLYVKDVGLVMAPVRGEPY